MPKIRKKALARALGAVTASVAAAASAVVATGQPVMAATVMPVSAALGATISLTDLTSAGASALTAAPAVLLRPASENCAATYAAPTAPTVSAEAATKAGDTSVTFRIPTTLALGTNGVARALNACVYPSATSGAALVSGTTSPLTAYPSLSSNPGNGFSGATNSLTLTASTSIFTSVSSPAALFTSGACPAVFIPSGIAIQGVTVKSGLANTVVVATVPAGVVGSGPVNVCVYAGNTATDALLGAAVYQLALPQLTLSSSSGPSDAVTNITASSGTTSLFSGISAPGVLLNSSGTCPTTYLTSAATIVAVPGSGIRKLANNRVAITVPKLTSQGAYQMCVYSGSSSESMVLGSAPYTVTVLPNPLSVIPAAGPTTGGTTITVTGTAFPTVPGSISATLGGTDLINITPVNSTSFTATVPMHSAQESAALVVTTANGTRTLPGAFSFRNALKLIGVNTAPNTATAVDVLVQGTDLLSQAFGTSSDNAKIYLVHGEYDSSQAEGGNRANGPVAECNNVLVLGDTELVCTLRLNRRLDKTGNNFVDPLAGAVSLTGLSTILGSRLLTSGTAVFGQDDVGRVLSQTGGAGEIPAGTTIKSVLTPFLAILSNPATATGGTLAAGLGGAVRTITNSGTGNGILTKTGDIVALLPGTPLTRADVGRVFKDTPGITDGTSITAVAPNGASVTLSAPAVAVTGAGATTVSVTSAALGSTTLTGTFTSADVGAVFGPNIVGIPEGAKILSQTGGTTATISQATTMAITGAITPTVTKVQNLSLFPGAPVLDGAYNLTIVSNGAPGASAGSDYKQTAVTSGSTFTVSPF